MFIREMSPDGKVSFWTIRPEANRCLTLDQVYKVSTFHILPTPYTSLTEEVFFFFFNHCVIVIPVISLLNAVNPQGLFFLTYFYCEHIFIMSLLTVFCFVFFLVTSSLAPQPGCDPMTAPISVPMLLFPQVRLIDFFFLFLENWFHPTASRKLKGTEQTEVS